MDDKLNLILNIFPKNKSVLPFDKIVELTKSIVTNNEELEDLLSQLKRKGLVEGFIKLKCSITDSGLDIGKDDQGKEYVIRKLLENERTFNFYQLNGRKFKDETERLAIIQSLRDNGYIRKLDGAIGQTYMLTDIFRNEQLVLYRDLALQRLDKMSDDEILSDQFISELQVPDMYRHDFKKLLEIEGYITITTRTRQGDLFKKGARMGLYFLNSILQNNSTIPKQSRLSQDENGQKIDNAKTAKQIIMEPTNSNKLKVFIGWSGDESQAMARRLTEWLPAIVPDITIFFSQEIYGGATWFTEIAKGLKEANYGILCVTKENLNSQWINFEAGALWKGIGETPVCPLLMGLTSAELKGPLVTFQAKTFDEHGIRELCRLLAEKTSLDARRVDINFKGIWPQLHSDIHVDIDIINKTKLQGNGSYGIQISYPEKEEVLNTPFNLSGTYKTLPPHGQIIALVINPKTNEYWPKNDLVYDTRNLKWHTEIEIKGAFGEERVVVIASIGRHMKSLIDFRTKVFEKTKKSLGLEHNAITYDDMDILDQITIKIALSDNA